MHRKDQDRAAGVEEEREERGAFREPEAEIPIHGPDLTDIPGRLSVPPLP
ncbi:MAG: hypothetical protein HY698_11905 [Deltaproteobacteria bacterium]|nr:hypothetical protein [Deltaproteobacteria bacterium]